MLSEQLLADLFGIRRNPDLDKCETDRKSPSWLRHPNLPGHLFVDDKQPYVFNWYHGGQLMCQLDTVEDVERLCCLFGIPINPDDQAIISFPDPHHEADCA